VSPLSCKEFSLDIVTVLITDPNYTFHFLILIWLKKFGAEINCEKEAPIFLAN